MAYASPMWLWAAPVVAPPPPDITPLVMKTVLRSGCQWWCKGRWWATRLNLHPLYGSILRGLKVVLDPEFCWSPHVETQIRNAVERLGMGLRDYDTHFGLCLEVLPGDDPRVKKVTSHVYAKDAPTSGRVPKKHSTA